MTTLTKSDYEFIKSHIDQEEYFSLQKETEFPKVRIEPGRFSTTHFDGRIKEGDYYVGVNVTMNKTSGFGIPIPKCNFEKVFGTYENFCRWLGKRGLSFENPEIVSFGEQLSMF